MGASGNPEPSPDSASTAAATLTLAHQHLSGMITIAIGGEVDRTNCAQLADYTRRVYRPGDHVVFNLAEVSFMDSSGLQVLLACARQSSADGAGVHLAAARGAPARLLHITGLDMHLPVYATVEDAVTAVLGLQD